MVIQTGLPKPAVLREMMRQFVEHQTRMVLETLLADAPALVELLHLVIQAQKPGLVDEPHFRLGFQDGDEWYYVEDCDKDITLQVVLAFFDRAALDDKQAVPSDFPTFEYRVGFVWGWLFALIRSGNVVRVQPVVMSSLVAGTSLVVVGPPIHNDSPRERSMPNATQHTPNNQRQLAAPGRRRNKRKEG